MKTLTIAWGSEAALIKKASRGDVRAFDEIALRYRGSLYAMAYRMLRNADDAFDAVQETLVKAWKSIGTFDPERAIKPWLCRICANCCVDIVRARKEKAESLEVHSYYLVDPSDTPGEAAEESETEQAISKAIDRLPGKYREIFMMRHYRQMEVSEIAAHVGAPEGTIKSWLFRARRQLQRELVTVAG